MSENERLLQALEIVEAYARSKINQHELELDQNPHIIGSVEDFNHEMHHVRLLNNAKIVAWWCDVQKRKFNA
jgi:hemerythrin-like domain-containing protein